MVNKTASEVKKTTNEGFQLTAVNRIVLYVIMYQLFN